jgi:hypothetical protein
VCRRLFKGKRGLEVHQRTHNKPGGVATPAAPRGKPFAMGEDSRRGVGLPGRSGRIPDELVARCEKAAIELVLPQVEAYLVERGYVLADSDTRGPGPSSHGWRWAADYVLGKVRRVDDDAGEFDVEVKIRRAAAGREELLGVLARMATAKKTK